MEQEQPNADTQIWSIEVLKCTLAAPTDAQFPIDSFNFDVRIQIKADKERRLVFIIVQIEVRQEPKSEILGELAINCMFEIDNFTKVVAFDEVGGVILDSALSQTLSAISLSTARGYMFAQFQGTFLHGAILPIIDPGAFRVEG